MKTSVALILMGMLVLCVAFASFGAYQQGEKKVWKEVAILSLYGETDDIIVNQIDQNQNNALSTSQ